MLGLTVYANLKENLLVVSNIYSCHIMSRHNSPQNCDHFLRYASVKNTLDVFITLKLILKIQFNVMYNSKKWKSFFHLVVTNQN